ncbi:MAG: hypothetical protein Q9216_005484 [Gyalolechia sp. 2 TL-2023]
MFTEFTVSGIHRLFAAASSQSSQSSRPPHLQSVTEESHTYDLLYPDHTALQQSQDQLYPLRLGNPSSLVSAASGFDDRGGLDIQNPRDVRVIIAQDGNLSQQAKVLFDTHPPPSLPAGRLGSPLESKGSTNGEVYQSSLKTDTSPGPPTRVKHTRYFSLGRAVQAPTLDRSSPLAATPASEQRGAFGNLRLRRANARPVTSDGETFQSRKAREGKEEVEALLGCMFGTTGLPLVSGTKLHVRPSGSTVGGDTTRTNTSPMSPGEGSAQRRRTPLTRSTTVDSIHMMSASAPAERVEANTPRSHNASILITRLFTVDPAEPLSPRLNNIQSQSLPPGPEVSPQDFQTFRRPSNVSETASAKQFKLPAYAISLMLRLPSASRQGWSSASQVASPLSPDSDEALHFSHDSQWTEAQAPEGPLCGADRDIEQVITHWSLLTRLMAALEVKARNKILALLASIDLASIHSMANSSPTAAKATNDHTMSPVKKVRQPSQRIIQLPADALQNLEDIRQSVCTFGRRIAAVLRTQRVVTGQGRWGVWREEARWVGRWAGNREQNFFFFNLLTVFLGLHTDWLDLLEGLRTRRSRHRFEKRQRIAPIGRQQTVIVSTNKMAARRLIFLLSAFLPSTAQQMQEALLTPKFTRTGTSMSQSPPSGIPILREMSLRRTINRRQRGNRSSQSSAALHTRSLSFAGPESRPSKDEDTVTLSKSGQHFRRASNARSIMTPALPIVTTAESTRKSSTTTTSTIAPETAVPVAHFSNATHDPLMGTTPVPRPGSSGSLASLSLQHTLHRSESNDHSNSSTGSQSFGRWGSMMSGFWSSRRESSTDESECISRSAEGLGISGVTKMPGQSNYAGTLERMVEEAEVVSHPTRQSRNGDQYPPAFSSPDRNHESSAGEAVVGSATQARAIPERPKAENLPVKLSVDDNDGIIDVQLPASYSYSSSFGSSIGSIGQSHTAASSFNERSSIYTRSPSKERTQHISESPAHVAGWLEEYSQDFSLQAVCPYPGLRNDIEEGMKTEPAIQLPIKRTSSDDSDPHGWTEVGTSLIADTSNFSITRLCLQRRPKTRNPPSTGPPWADSELSGQSTEERIVEEPVMDMDPILIDAVERVLARSGHSSRAQSRAPSRAPSPTRPAKASDQRRVKSQNEFHASCVSQENMPKFALEVPKSECKKVVLGALEEVVRSVQAEQDTGESGARHISGEPVRDGDSSFPPDSTLREGVRKWLRGVGPISVASISSIPMLEAKWELPCEMKEYLGKARDDEVQIEA